MTENCEKHKIPLIHFREITYCIYCKIEEKTGPITPEEVKKEEISVVNITFLYWLECGFCIQVQVTQNFKNFPRTRYTSKIINPVCLEHNKK